MTIPDKVIYTKAVTSSDLEKILALQKRNLAFSLTREEINEQGFVTVDHSYAQLHKLNELEKHVVAKYRGEVVGYLLAMTPQSRCEIPILKPMFAEFGKLSYDGKNIADYRYLVVGQVCIEKAFRGKGVLDDCYTAYRDFYGDNYDFAITEIAATNLRSLKAHRRVGFVELATYKGPDNIFWVVVLWDWRNFSDQKHK